MKTHITLDQIEAIANIGSYETDLTNGTWRGSRNFIKIFGLQPKDFYTVEEFQAVVHPEDFDEVMTYFSECLKKKMDFDYEYRCINAAQETIYVSSKSQILYAADGTPLKVYGTKQDITKRKLIELKLSESHELNEEKNAVLKLVAHDLRTPINQIQMINELMISEANGQSMEYLKLQKDICSHAETIISELVEMAELDGDRQTLEFEIFDINEIIRNSLQIFDIQAREKSIGIKADLCADASIRCSREKLRRVVDNLLSNAIKFTPAGKCISIKTVVEGEKVVFQINDEGIGIPAQALDSLFKEFSKSIRRPGIRGEKSTGLGLSIVKQIVDMHKGEIFVESEENYGTKFTIKFSKNGTLC